MDIETFRDHCLALPGTTEGMKWDHLCFMLEEKIFVLVLLEDGHFCMKCNPEEFDALAARPGIRQAPHFARRQWIEVEGLEVMPDQELLKRVKESRELVLIKLSKKLQQKYA
ncbi:MmcQ/YjbR family DNA-binding protein [Pedobacter deserti]|uniref:MmcQ/YjbR family DNA-binding protein n=1 Tax=Pedobacter deserti TaxID=2817382 RepID=UPI002108CF80|nr:MmcQ/YjbR family DNA-binding protein [Pedobacter sp. SYSU D00382]